MAEDPKAIAASLGGLERELMLNTASGWGSWMWECSMGLVAKGLAEKRISDTGVTVTFDTPLAKAVIEELRKEAAHG
jgi:hypothetical protein